MKSMMGVAEMTGGLSSRKLQRIVDLIARHGICKSAVSVNVCRRQRETVVDELKRSLRKQAGICLQPVP